MPSDAMLIVYSKLDIASENAAAELIRIGGFKQVEDVAGHAMHIAGQTKMLEIDTAMVNAGFLDDLVDTDLIVFLSKHRSEKGVASFTVHAEGNWSGKADLGGTPRQLSYAAPVQMLAVLKVMHRLNAGGIEVTYEATHHGPLLVAPSMFVEIGGNDNIIASREHAKTLAESVKEALLDWHEPDFGAVAVGIGGMHYPGKFTRLALEGKYAFAHILPKYYVNELDMLGQAFERSSVKPEKAVIEWKSINAVERESVIKRLGELGMDYDRV
jgi:D-aminoacyl-tRNA deacylase